jgi:hypothetical protein
MLAGKPEAKRLLLRPRRRWEYNIKIVLKEILCGGFGLVPTDSGYGPVAGVCEHSNEPSDYVKGGKFISGRAIIICCMQSQSLVSDDLWSHLCVMQQAVALAE